MKLYCTGKSGFDEEITLNHERQVDVILPFHRVDDFLLRALDSIEQSKQIRPHIILIDDRKTKEPCAKLESKLNSLVRCNVSYFENYNHGYGNAINLGLTKILNPWVALMNSDDLISEDRLYQQIFAIENTNSDGAICELIKFKFFKFIHIPPILGKISMNSYNSSYLLLGAYGADATLVLKAAKFLNLNFNTAKLCGDWITALTKYPELKIISTPRAKYYYRIHAKQSSNMQIASNDVILQEIFNSWAELNDALGLPEVTLDEFIFIAAPWARNKDTDPSRESFQFWFKEFLRLNCHSHDMKSLRKAQKRRLLLLDAHQKNFSNLMVPVLLTVSLELIYKKFLGALAR